VSPLPRVGPAETRSARSELEAEHLGQHVDVAGVVPRTSPSASTTGRAVVDLDRRRLPLAHVVAGQVGAGAQLRLGAEHVDRVPPQAWTLNRPSVGRARGATCIPPPKNCPLATTTLQSGS
jgi:hypothetical protein